MLPAEKRARIITTLRDNPNASQVAREIGDVHVTTVRRIAKKAGIDLTAGQTETGHHRLSAEMRARIIAALRENPNAAQVAQQIGGVSRMTVWKIAKAAGIDLLRSGRNAHPGSSRHA
jgi:transposase-like protein